MPVIVFANQKGGVGKSTLAVMYANHLSGVMNKRVTIWETDVQKSIYDQRKDDILTWGEENMKYDVRYIQLDTLQNSESMMVDAKETFKNDIVIIDVPGNITDNYIAPLLIYADFIICPYMYETKVLQSTTTFIKVLKKLKKMFQDVMKPKILYVPNNIDPREGTAEELKQRMQIDEIFRTNGEGEVLPKIHQRADIKRLNTYMNTQKQEYIGSSCFSELDKHILG